MDIVNTSLEALIQRATCTQNQCPDTAAIDAFCGLVSKEPECAQTATRFITAKVHSLHEWEALQALHVLDACMKRCGSNFHSEVGKFRFLNELIKLVSPKYNGAHTPEPVKRRVLELMQSWTVYYPHEFKIKEAYDMLKKQGVVKEELLRPQTEGHKNLDQNIVLPPRNQDSIFQDSEKSRLLQKLLQSKNPDDLQAANRLIKTMVKEDERRVELKSRHLSELEAAHNNARLLSEMLDSFSSEASSLQDLELINELKASCLRFRPNVQKLLSEVHNDERLFNEVLAANDELGEVLDKYAVVIERLEPVAAGSNLLDLSSPCEPETQLTSQPLPLLHDLSTLELEVPVAGSLLSSSPLQPQPALATLEDVFSSLTTVQHLPSVVSLKPVEEPVIKTGLEELDALSESLLRQSLPQTTPQPQVRVPCKISMNQLSQQASPSHLGNSAPPPPSTISQPTSLTALPFDPLDLLINSVEGFNLTAVSPPSQVNGDPSFASTEPQPKPLPTDKCEITSIDGIKTETVVSRKTESGPVKPIGDLTVSLESIMPGKLPPLKVLEEHNVSVTIHYARDSPRPDVSVFVVTTTSKSQFPISDYLFQAIVPKGCRLRLQPPSSTDLPAHNPFLPPAAITQVMLIASPHSHEEPISLRVVVSFTMDDETITEMKEVDKFFLKNS